MNYRKPRAFAVMITLILAALLLPTSVHAATNPGLGTAGAFAVLAGSTVTNTGPTIVSGDLGVSPGTAATGFPPGIVTGVQHLADAVALQAQIDANTAYNNLAQTCTANLSGQDLGGLTLTPGVYCFDAAAQLTGTLTLDGKNDPNSVFIFIIGSTLTTASDAAVAVIDDANSCGIFWKVGSSATLGTNTQFLGNVLALTSITLTTNATAQGGLYARNGAVTLDSNSVQVCSAAPPPAATATTTDTATATETSTATATATATDTATITPVVISTQAPIATSTFIPVATSTTIPAAAATIAPVATSTTIPPVAATTIPVSAVIPNAAPSATNTATPVPTDAAILPDIAATVAQSTASAVSTSTPSPTATATARRKPSITRAATPSATVTTTATRVKRATNTLTTTATATATGTATPFHKTIGTPGRINVHVATVAATRTPRMRPTRIPSLTVTATPTVPAALQEGNKSVPKTPGKTPIAVATPSVTAIPSATNIPRATATQTATNIPRATATQAATAVPSATPTPYDIPKQLPHTGGGGSSGASSRLLLLAATLLAAVCALAGRSVWTIAGRKESSRLK